MRHEKKGPIKKIPRVLDLQLSPVYAFELRPQLYLKQYQDATLQLGAVGSKRKQEEAG